MSHTGIYAPLYGCAGQEKREDRRGRKERKKALLVAASQKWPFGGKREKVAVLMVFGDCL